jgi:hypothetical protein
MVDGYGARSLDPLDPGPPRVLMHDGAKLVSA